MSPHSQAQPPPGALVGNSERQGAITSDDSILIADGMYAEGVRNAILLRDEGIFSEAEFVREREVFVILEDDKRCYHLLSLIIIRDN